MGKKASPMSRARVRSAIGSSPITLEAPSSSSSGVAASAPASVNPDEVTVDNISEVVDSGLGAVYEIMNRSELTNSQEMRLHVYVGDLAGLRDKLTMLIALHAEDEEMLMHFMHLLSRIDATIELYGLSELSEGAGAPEAGANESEWLLENEDDGGHGEEVNDDESWMSNASMRLSEMMSNLAATSSAMHPTSPSFLLPPEQAAEEFMCPICCDEVPGADGVLLRCHSPGFYCTECLEGYLHHRINEGRVMPLPCPDPACDHELTEPLVRWPLAPSFTSSDLACLLTVALS